MLLHPLTIGSFGSIYLDALRLCDLPNGVDWPVRDRRVGVLRIQAFDRDKGSLEDLISYSGKVGRITAAGLDYDTSRVFPEGISIDEYRSRGMTAMEKVSRQVLGRPASHLTLLSIQRG
jgi:hypothetical protein